MAALKLAACAYGWSVLWLAAWATLPALLAGLSPVVVMSGSMEPSIAVGDVLLYQQAETTELVPGRVIVADDPSNPSDLLTHRVSSIADDGTVRTKGDANAEPDSTPLKVGDIRGVGRLVVPSAGLPAVWLRQSSYLPFTLWLVVTVAALWLAAAAWRRPAAGRQEAPPTSGTGDETDSEPLPSRSKHGSAPWLLLTVMVVGPIVQPVGARAAWAAVTGSAANTWVAATLDAPDALTATARCSLVTGLSIDLEWARATDRLTTSYTIQRRRATTTFTTIATVGPATTTSYTDTSSLANSTTYYYRVRSSNGGSWLSAWSPTASATTAGVLCT